MAPAAASHDREGKTYVVEHLDPELGPWSVLEYVTIAQESRAAGATFCLTSVPPSLAIPEELKSAGAIEIDSTDVESKFQHIQRRVCLLDPKAATELSPRDADTFDVFVFGGILGKRFMDLQSVQH